jgi:hypothetical protein
MTLFLRQYLTKCNRLIVGSVCLLSGLLMSPVLAQTEATADSTSVIFQERFVTTLNNVTFTNDFAGGGLQKVEVINDSCYALTIAPENTPINKSPWYAFKTWATSPRVVYVRFQYAYARHRYNPKISSDGEQWSGLPESSVMRDSSDQVTMKLDLTTDTLWIASQEVIPTRRVYQWAEQVDQRYSQVTSRVIGQSIQGRPLTALHIGRGENKNVLVILSRQHPPEVTGYMAMQAFTEELLTKAIYKKYRKQFDVVIIPMINPDGVDLGHWRHNVNGVDTNRDWETFAQPETRAVRDYLVELGKKQKILFCLDFHSTLQDVMYVVTDDPQSVTTQWVKRMEDQMPGTVIKTSFHGVESATSKNWIYKTFQAEAVTYEVGDKTDRHKLIIIGQTAARELVNEILKRLNGK